MSLIVPGSVRATSSTLEQMLTEARSRLVRITPQELHAVAADAVILDTRTPTDRALYGCIPGSVHTPRTVLEWRVAMDAPLRLSAITSTEQLLVVVCNEGFSSSLAAVTLQQLGFLRATDLIGGVLAWSEAGLPLEPPTGNEIGVQDSTVSER
jgi:rhodanese-related sulfurtransferase